MTNLKEMIMQMKEQAVARVNTINGKQSAIITLMKELKDLLSSSKAMAKEYEEMGTMLLNMADDLRGQAEDVSEWAIYDVSLEEDEDDEEDDDDDLIECDNCGKEMQWGDEVIYDEYGWGFCCDECREKFHQECDNKSNAEENGN